MNSQKSQETADVLTEKKPARKPAQKASKKKTTQKKTAKRAAATKKTARKATVGPKSNKNTANKDTKAEERKDTKPESENAASAAGGKIRHAYVTRPADLDDVPAMVAIGNELGFFDPDNTDEAVEMLTQYFSGKLARHAWLVAEADAVVVGAAYFLPEPGTVGTWRLRFLGVGKQHQGRGGGQALLTKVEETLAMTKGRIVVETAAVEGLQPIQEFFAKHSYSEQARIQDFFNVDIDKIIQLKVL